MSKDESEIARVPLAFPHSSWPRNLRPAVQAFWRWHQYLWDPVVVENERSRFYHFIEEEKQRVLTEEKLRLIPNDMAVAAYEACRQHNLPLSLLANQVEASARFLGPLHFESFDDLDQFIDLWGGSHARLLAMLAGVTGSWQRPLLQELTRAFFLTGRLVEMPQDLKKDRVYVPMEELRHADVDVRQLKAGIVDEKMQKLLWKQVVRARDSFAQGQALVKDLPAGLVRGFKRYWIGGLTVLDTIERRGYDVWSSPIQLSTLQRIQVHTQALIGKTSFR